MLQANSIVENEQTTQERARIAIAAYAARSGEQISPGPIPLRKARRLDVDEVLARSLPKALSPQLQTISGAILSLGRRSLVATK